MTKEKLLQKICEKLGKTSLSERTLSTYAENLSKIVGDDSQIDDNFLSTHVNILKSIEGQINHDITDGIENWKAKQPSNKPNDDILGILAEIKEDNKKLKERLDSEENKKAQEDFRNSVKNAMRNKGAKNDYILKQIVSQKDFDLEKSVDDVVEDMLKEYDDSFKSCFGNGASPREPEGNGSKGEEAVKKALDSFFEKKANEGKFPSSVN